MSERNANGDGSAQSIGISRRFVLGEWWKCQVQREQGARKREPFGQFCQVLLWTLNSWKGLMSFIHYSMAIIIIGQHVKEIVLNSAFLNSATGSSCLTSIVPKKEIATKFYLTKHLKNCESFRSQFGVNTFGFGLDSHFLVGFYRFYQSF